LDLPETVRDLNTVKRFPPSLRGTIHEAFLSAVSEELAIWRESIRLKKTRFYDIDEMDIDRLTEICGTFGVPFITSVRSDLPFLREEVRSIPMKIYFKGTPTLYKSFFYAVDRYGEIFIYIYQADVDNIVRAMLKPFDEAYLTPPNLPFRHRSREDFSGSIEDWLRLDTDRFLDAGDALWRLDTPSTEISTNHIGLEYFIDRLIFRSDLNEATGVRDTNEYLMTKEYLDYMYRSMEFARRTKEVIHIGSQLSVQSEADGLCNSYDPSSEYSVPSLKLKVITRADFFNLVTSPHDISYVEFGIGKQDVASVQSPDVPFPTELASRVCTVPALFRNRFQDSHFLGAIGEYLGQSLSGFRVLDGSAFDGARQDFDFVLPFAPIQRGNITVAFHLPSGEILRIPDNRRGVLLSQDGYGNIDYRTGEGHISTKFHYPQTDIIDTAILPDVPDTTDGRTHFAHTMLGGSSVIPGSIWLTFTIGEGAEQRTYMVNDDGNGNFVHPSIQTGLVDYITKNLDITFLSPLVDPAVKSFSCQYSFLVDFVLPAGTELRASYFFTQQSIYITEAGFRSKDGDILSYATFPPFEFNSNAYHLSFMILIRKPPGMETEDT
jgi:hypothetical protein